MNFFSDASASKILGCGAIFGDNWLFAQWEEGFIAEEDPSIEFLELYALWAAVLTWSTKLQNVRILINCDNISVVYMVNNMTSGCKYCMNLLRQLTLDNLNNNRRVFVQHVEGKNNKLSDALSRLEFKKFFKIAPESVNKYPDKIMTQLWPLSIWWKKTKALC